jgi:PEGA domain/SmpA / OmlA family
MWMRIAIGVLSVSFLASPGKGQEKAELSNQRAILGQILTQSYQPSVIGKQVMGVGADTAVRRAGVIVVVQHAGLYGSLQRNEIASTAIHGLDAEVYRGNKDYAIPVGERFYVTSASVGGETVTLGLLSARGVSTQHGAGRVWAIATFFFPAETLANADKDAVFRAIDPWLMPEGRATVSAGPAVSAAPAPVTATPSPAVPASVPQPVAAAAAPAKLAPGMTREQVMAALGAPQREVSFGGQTWLTYPGMVVLLKDEKLASIDASGQAPAKVAIHSDPAGAEIYLDGQLAGSTPSTLELPAGNHQISVKLAGYQDWARDLRALSGSEINLDAKLEKK